jgi:hypothetical protein
MCPFCITTAVLSAAGASSGAGVVAMAAGKWRILQRRSIALLSRLPVRECPLDAEDLRPRPIQTHRGVASWCDGYQKPSAGNS